MQIAGEVAAQVIWYCNTENIEWDNQVGPDVHYMEGVCFLVILVILRIYWLLYFLYRPSLIGR